MANAAQKRSRRRLVELACICFAVAQLGWFVFPEMETLTGAEFDVQDKIIAFSGLHPSAQDFVFVKIDDPSLKLDQLWPEDLAESPSLTAMSAGWPWPRTVYADAAERILGAGARVVIFDIILNAEKPGDAVFKATLDRHPRQIVLGANLSFDSLNPDHPELAMPTFSMPAGSLIDSPDQDPRVGFVNFIPQDSDQKIRSALYGLRSGNRDYPSLAASAARLIGSEKLVPEAGRFHLFRYANLSNLNAVPFFTLFLPQEWKRLLHDGAIFKDKIVVVGPSAAILHDIHLVPNGIQLPGPLLHVNALISLLNGSFYTRAGAGVSIAMVMFAAMLAWALTAFFRGSPLAAAGALLTTGATLLLVAYAISAWANYLLPVVQPGAVLFVAGIACTSWNFAQARRESGRMRSTLERYVSRNVVREILDNQEDFLSALGGTRKPMTVFFSDVRGFTSFAEKEDAHAIVGQLNEYLGEMVGVIFRHHGTVDKFMGDGIMAEWGNVISEGVAKDALHAVQAALEMLERLKTLNDAWTKRGLTPFAIGIGLHHGEAVFGNIGSAEKMEPTVIGDTVNLASRVEGLTKKYGVTFCITQPLAELVADQFRLRPVDLVQVVGKSHPIEILTVLGRRDMVVPDWIKYYEGAIADFRARRFAEAAAALRLCLGAAPEDKLCQIYLDRASNFLTNPPPENWNGAEIATSK